MQLPRSMPMRTARSIRICSSFPCCGWTESISTSKTKAPSHRQSPALAGAVAAPLCSLQRQDHRRHHDRRSLLGQHRGLGGLFRAHDRRAIYCRGSQEYRAKQDPADRVLRRPDPLSRNRASDARRLGWSGRRDWRLFRGPVHLCRTRHRLTRKQQHRGKRLHPDGARTAPPSPHAW